MGFDKCIITCICHHSDVQSNFPALNILCALLIHPSLPLKSLDTTDFFLFFFFNQRHSFALSRTSYIWNHKVRKLSFLSSHGLVAYIFLVLNSISLSQVSYHFVDFSHEIKRCFLLGRKAMTNLDSILKSRDITLPTKVCLVKTMAFFSSHVWM